MTPATFVFSAELKVNRWRGSSGNLQQLVVPAAVVNSVKQRDEAIKNVSLLLVHAQVSPRIKR